MKELIRGVIEAVSEERGGVKIVGDGWYNAEGKAKQFVNKDLKGKIVRLIAGEKENGFSAIFPVKDFTEQKPMPADEGKRIADEKQPVKPAFETNSDYWARKDARIGRMAALNTATELIKVADEHNKIADSNLPPIMPDDVFKAAKILAEQIIAWVEQK